jgi:hypothetical protein
MNKIEVGISKIVWGGSFMPFTCKFQVTNGLSKMDVPHVNEIHPSYR